LPNLGTTLVLEWTFSALEVAAFLLILSSAFYVPLESRSRQGTKAARLSRIAHISASAILLFVFLLVALGYPTLARAWRDTIPVLAAMTLVHSVRFTLDWKQAAKLRGPRPKVHKILVDAGANALVVLSALLFLDRAVEDNFSKLYLIITGLLGALMVCKELWYRIVDDMILYKKPVFLVWTEVQRSELSKLLVIQEVFNRFTKSIFYIVIGYALLYSALLSSPLARANMDVSWPKTSGPSLLDYILFSVSQLFGSAPMGNASAWVKSVALTETFVGILFLGLVLSNALAPRKIELHRRRPKKYSSTKGSSTVEAEG